MQSRTPRSPLPAAAGLLVWTLLAPTVRADIAGASGVTEIVSLDSTGQIATLPSSKPSLSEDGRFVAFSSYAPLLPADPDGDEDVYVLDRQTGDLVCASTTQAGLYGDASSRGPFISADGRWVVFESLATNLQSLDFNAQWDVYRKDLLTGELVRASDAHLSPLAGNSASTHASVSDDGRYVAFASYSSDLIASDTNGLSDVFVRDMLLGQTQRVSNSIVGEPNGNSTQPMISGDGTRVAYTSVATNLYPFDNNGTSDVFVTQPGGNAILVSRSQVGLTADNYSIDPSISSDGSRVAFTSRASNMVDLDTNGWEDVFVFDVPTLTNTRVSVTSAGTQLGDNSNEPCISRDGLAVAFKSYDNAAPLSSPYEDVYVHDIQTGGTWTVSLPSGTFPGPNAGSSSPAVAQGGAVIAFDSEASNLLAGDTNALSDVFVRTSHPDPFAYCSSTTTIQGCVPQLSSFGYPSVSLGVFFTIIGDDLPNQRTGLLFYGFEGQSSNPWAGSTMCVAGIKRRTPLMTTGGLPQPANDCTGFFAFDMDHFAAGLLGGNPHPGLTNVGQVVNVQFWGREGWTGTYLTTALQYVVGP